VRTQLEDFDLSGALETVWGLVRRLNRLVEERAPWRLAKEATAEAAGGLGDGCAAAALARPGTIGGAGASARLMLDTTLWELAEGLRLLSVLLYAFMPQSALAIRERLGLGAAAAVATAATKAAEVKKAAKAARSTAAAATVPSWDEARWDAGVLHPGTKVTAGPALFPRIEE
jgi:methionyl-tRNA synthetase